MHPNPIFHTESADRNLSFARQRAFGVLVAGADGSAPLLSHVPFLLDAEQMRVHLHLVRSNPIARLLRETSTPARIAVSGPDSYVSPDWYGIDDQVPTWNYIAVHLTGILELRPSEELQALLERQSAHFENQLRPKCPWTHDKMSPGVMDKMMRQIVPCRLTIEDVDGTWKMNQNKPGDVRLHAADHVAKHGIGSETDALAAMTRQL